MDFSSSPQTQDDSTAIAVGSRLKAVYDGYYDRLVSQLRARYGSGPPDPADIGQAAFEKLADHSLLNDIANIEAYSWTIANNLMRNERRALRVRAAHANQEIV
ncbi:MAG: hypothetical protein AAF559_07535, partial [Pseudomonadota bacterium]